MTTRNQEGYLTNDIDYLYDDNGQMIELKNRKGYRYEFKYDENGNRIEKQYFIRGRGRETTDKYKYDDIGNMVESEFYNSDGKLYRKKLYEYQYR